MAVNGVERETKIDYWEVDSTLFARIHWDAYTGTYKQKELFKYLQSRCKEIADRNVRERYSDMVDVFVSGSMKKNDYKAKFNAFVNALLKDEQYYYILEGIQYYVTANVPLKARPLGDAQNCAICAETLFIPDRTIKILKCMHAFHDPCVSTWLKRVPECPICRQAQ